MSQSKTYTYDVKIRASLDNSRLSGAGSSTRNSVQGNLVQEENKLKQSYRRRAQVEENFLSESRKRWSKPENSPFYSFTKQALNSKDAGKSFQPMWSGLETESQRVGKKSGHAFIGSMRGALIGMGVGMAIGFGLDFASTVVTTIDSFLAQGIKFERTVKAFEAVSTSSRSTYDQLKELDDLARDTPGLTFQDAVVGEQRLLAVGFAAKEATGLLEGLSKEKIRSGAGNDEFERTVVNLQQIKSTGVATQREIREILHALPTMADAFNSAFGTTNAQRIEDLGLSGAQVIRKLNEEMAKTPGVESDTQDALDKLTSRWLKSSVAFADPALPDLTNLFKHLTVTLDNNKETFAAWGESFAKVVRLVDTFSGSKSFYALEKLATFAFSGTIGGVISNVADLTDRLGLTSRPETTSASDQQTKDDLKATKAAKQAYAEYLDDRLSASRKAIIGEKNDLINRAGFSKEAQTHLNADLKALEVKATNDDYNIREEYWDKVINLEGLSGKQVEELMEERGKNLGTISKTNEKAITENLREELKNRLQGIEEYYERRKAFSQAELDNTSLVDQARVDSLDKSTIEKQIAASEQSYNLKRDSLEKQFELEEEFARKKSELVKTDLERGRIAEELALNRNKKDSELKAAELQRDAEIRAQKQAQFAQSYKATGGNSQTAALVQAATKLGINPLDLATFIGFETGGTYDPWQKGPRTKWGQHRGLIQFGEPQQAQYGVSKGQTFEEQITTSVVQYLRDVFKQAGRTTAGASLQDLYSAVLAGGVGEKYLDRSDGYTTPRKAVASKQMADHRRRAAQRFFGGEVPEGVIFGNEFEAVDTGDDSDRATKAERDLRTRTLDKLFTKIGTIPNSELMKAILGLRVEDARSGRAKSLIQPTEGDLAEEFRQNVLGRGGAQSYSGPGIATSITNRKVLDPKLVASILGIDPDYVERLTQDIAGSGVAGTGVGSKVSEALASLDSNFNKGARDANKSDRTNLLLRERNIAEEITLAIEAQATARTNEALDLKKEFDLLNAQNPLEEQQLEMARERNALRKRSLDVVRDLAAFEAQNADAEFVKERRQTSMLENRLSLKRELADIEDEIANIGQNDSLEIAVELAKQQRDFRKEELDDIIEIEKSRREIARMDDFSANGAGAKILDHLARQKNLTESVADSFISIYDSVNGLADKGIDKLTEKLGIFKGAVGGLLKFGAQSSLTKITTSILDKVAPGLGDKYVESSNPVVAGLKKQDTQISLLRQIAANTSGGGAAGAVRARIAGGGGGGIGNILTGGGTTPPFFPSGTTGGGGGILNFLSSTGEIPGGVSHYGIGNITGGGSGGGILGRLQGLVGKGGIFGSKGFGFNSGTIGAFGGLASVAGGAIGGTTGSILSGIGSGVGAASSLASILGISALGGPIGLLVGGAIGGAIALFGALFGKSKRRKQEEKQRTQILVDSKAKMRDLINGVRSHRISGRDALAQGQAIRADYISQVSQLKDKKTRNIALATVRELDAMLAELSTVSAQSMADEDRAKQIVPEFASGGVVGGFQRRSGVLSGGIPGRDSIPTLAMEGEMFLTKQQQQRVINSAGHNVFKDAGIPGYGRVAQPNTPAAFATGGTVAGTAGAAISAAPVSVGNSGGTQQQITIEVTPFLDTDGLMKIAVQSDSVNRDLIKVVNKAFKNGEIRTS
jgi:tape measure domain-containing protein